MSTDKITPAPPNELGLLVAHSQPVRFAVAPQLSTYCKYKVYSFANDMTIIITLGPYVRLAFVKNIFPLDTKFLMYVYCNENNAWKLDTIMLNRGSGPLSIFQGMDFEMVKHCLTHAGLKPSLRKFSGSAIKDNKTHPLVIGYPTTVKLVHGSRLTVSNYSTHVLVQSMQVLL